MANKINRTDIYPLTTPADDDFVLGTDVSNTTNDPNGETVNFSIAALRGTAQQPPAEGAFQDGDKTKLDGIEAGADVTDTANVTAAGALMDSEVTNLAAVKAFDPADYTTKTSATGSAVLPSGTTAQRDGSPAAGYLRYNSTAGAFEGYTSEWVALSGGGSLIPVAKYTVSSAVAALEFTLPAGYTGYKIRLLNFAPVTDGVHLYMRTSADGGSTFDATADYDNALSYIGPGVAQAPQTSEDQNEINITATAHGVSNSGHVNSVIDLENCDSSSITQTFINTFYLRASARPVSMTGAATLLTANTTDAIQLLFSSGNIASGVVHVYGVLDGDA